MSTHRTGYFQYPEAALDVGQRLVVLHNLLCLKIAIVGQENEPADKVLSFVERRLVDVEGKALDFNLRGNEGAENRLDNDLRAESVGSAVTGALAPSPFCPDSAPRAWPQVDRRSQSAHRVPGDGAGVALGPVPDRVPLPFGESPLPLRAHSRCPQQMTIHRTDRQNLQSDRPICMTLSTTETVTIGACSLSFSQF